jgi:hypothetical protein
MAGAGGRLPATRSRHDIRSIEAADGPAGQEGGRLAPSARPFRYYAADPLPRVTVTDCCWPAVSVYTTVTTRPGDMSFTITS